LQSSRPQYTLWDAYEIAPYSMGPIDVTLPAGDLAEIIDRTYW
jgi:hypothetical protein